MMSWKESLGLMALVGIVIALIAIPLAIFMPWVPQAVGYAVLVKYPFLAQWWGLALISVLAASALGYSGRDGIAMIFIVLAGLFLVISVTFAPMAAGIQSQTTMADNVNDSAVEIEQLPNNSGDNVRILPREVGETYAENSLQEPRHSLGDTDIVYHNGSYHWAAGLEPEGFMNSWSHYQKGAVYIDMTTNERQIETIEGEFEKGQGMMLRDNYKAAMVGEDWWSDHKTGDKFVVQGDEQLHIVVPNNDHERHFSLTPLPQFHTTPTPGGVTIISEDGSTDSLSVEEALEDDRLEGNHFVSYDYAMYAVESMAYKHGVINKWFYHEDEIKVGSTGSSANEQPFTVPTEDGIQHVIAAEAAGGGSGVYQIWTIDARDGSISVMDTATGGGLIGPERSTTYVQQENPRVNWESMKTTEPIPLMVDGDLYWRVPVIPDSAAGVSYTAMVDADTGNVYEVTDDAAIYAFVQGEEGLQDIDEDVSTGEDGEVEPSDPGPSGDKEWVVIVLDEDGNPVDEVPLNEGGSVTIEEDD